LDTIGNNILYTRFVGYGVSDIFSGWINKYEIIILDN